MFVVLVLSLFAATYGAAPKGCCMNNKWNGVMIQVGAMKPNNSDPTIVDNHYKMDYDYDLKMIKLDGMTLDNNGQIHNLTVLDDFAHGKRYTVFDGFCEVAPVDTGAMTPPCIPGNFTFDGSYTLGGGANAMTVNTFSGFAFNTRMQFMITDECNPVTYTQYGSAPDGSNQFIYSFAFANITQGSLSMANPFVVPLNCKAATPGAVGK